MTDAQTWTEGHYITSMMERRSHHVWIACRCGWIGSTMHSIDGLWKWHMEEVSR